MTRSSFSTSARGSSANLSISPKRVGEVSDGGGQSGGLIRDSSSSVSGLRPAGWFSIALLSASCRIMTSGTRGLRLAFGIRAETFSSALTTLLFIMAMICRYSPTDYPFEPVRIEGSGSFSLDPQRDLWSSSRVVGWPKFRNKDCRYSFSICRYADRLDQDFRCPGSPKDPMTRGHFSSYTMNYPLIQ